MSKIDEILEGYKNGQLTYIDREGEHKIDVKEFVKTGSDNVLQKLNRTEPVLLKVANAAPEKLKWVNDYAMMKVINELYERVDDLSAGLIAKDTEIERLNNEAAASRVSFETADGISKEEADKLLERIAGMEADEQILQEKLNIEIVEHDELKKKYEELNERFNKSVEVYKELKNERDNISAKLVASSSESEQQYSELIKIYEDTKNSLNNANEQVISLNERLENAGEENLKLNDTINELQQMKTDLEQELNGYAADFEKASARCQEIDSRYVELNDEYEKQKDLIEKLEEQYNNTCEELNNIKESFGEATGKIRELDSTNVELQNKVNEQDNLIAGLNTTIESVNNEKTELQNSLEEKTKENALLAAKIRNSEKDTERLNMFESAINEMLNSIGWNKSTNVSNNNQEVHDNTMHRMGDNQVVDFNIGM